MRVNQGNIKLILYNMLMYIQTQRKVKKIYFTNEIWKQNNVELGEMQ